MLQSSAFQVLIELFGDVSWPEWRNLSQESQAPILVLRAACEAVWREILDQTYAEGMIAVEGDLMRHFIRGAQLETTNWFKADGKLTPRVLEEKLYQAIVRHNAEFVA